MHRHSMSDDCEIPLNMRCYLLLCFVCVQADGDLDAMTVKSIVSCPRLRLLSLGNKYNYTGLVGAA